MLLSLGKALAKAHQSSDEASLGRLRGQSASDEMTSVTILDGEHQPYGDKLTDLFASQLGLDFTGTKTSKYPYTPKHRSETPCTSEVTFQLFEDAHDLPLRLRVLPKASTEVDQ